MIEFKSVIEKTYMIDPAGNRVEQTIEHRIDPLTYNVASINTMLGEKARAFLGTADVEMLTDLQEKTKTSCPFCSAAEKGTRYLKEFVSEGQLRIGNSLAMPNLFSKCAFDSVVIINHREHVLFPSQIAGEDLGNAVKAAAELVRRARKQDSSLIQHVAGMNFLNPGGSSVPHPHLQVHVRAVPYSGIERLYRQSRDFFAKTGINYWTEFVQKEKETGARYIGPTGSVKWLAAYAPAHQKEIWGILPAVGSLAEISERDAEDFGAGLSKVITFYEKCGTHPFTFAFFSSAEEGKGRHFALHVRICSRPAFKPLYANYDTWFTPIFIGDEAHTETPEQYAGKLRETW